MNLQSSIVPQTIGTSAIGLDSISYRTVSRRWERQQCFSMVYDAYVRLGYMNPNPGRIRYSSYLTASKTATFAAVEHEHVIGTMTLFMAGEKGLPTEQIFSDEIAQLRQQGRKVAEVGALAHEAIGGRGGLERFLTLARMCCSYALKQGIDTCVIMVDPSHRDIYKKLLKAESLGHDRVYEGHPAVGFYFTRESLAHSRWFTSAPIPPVPQWAPEFSLEDKKYFEELVQGGQLIGIA